MALNPATNIGNAQPQPMQTVAAQHPAPAVTNGGDPNAAPVRRRRSQGKRIARPVTAYFVLQLLDEQGNPMEFKKSRIKVLACERTSDKVLDIIDSGEHEFALYLRGVLPAGRATTVAAA